MAHMIIINDANTGVKLPDPFGIGVLSEVSVFEKVYCANYYIQENNITTQ